MDIHKPKPWQGVQEFLKEFGTIVLGVLVALGAEQSVEWLHRQAEGREAREALRAEIGRDMDWALQNQRRESCDQRYLKRYVAWADGGPMPQNPTNSFLILSSTSWDVVKAGPVAFMPLKEKLAFANFYAYVADYNAMAERERAAALRMAEHEGLKRLDSDDAKSVRTAVQNFSMTESVLIGMAGGLQRVGAATGARAAPTPPKIAALLEAYCREAGSPASPG